MTMDPRTPRVPAGGETGTGTPTTTANNAYEWLTSPTAAFNPAAPMYGAMPQLMQYQPFMPGQQQAIASQLSQGFGQPAQSYIDQMNAIYRPVGITQMSEPLTQTMRAWGLQPTGQPGEVEAARDGFNPQGYQQWNQSTGSPWLDAMFGLNAGMGVPGQGATEDPKKKKNKTPTTPATPGYGTGSVYTGGWGGLL